MVVVNPPIINLYKLCRCKKILMFVCDYDDAIEIFIVYVCV